MADLSSLFLPLVSKQHGSQKDEGIFKKNYYERISA